MMASPLIAAIQSRLRQAAYDDLSTPFRIAGVEFQFTGAMKGRHGRALDLVLLVDTTAGDFGDSDAGRVRHRVQALSRALDLTGSRYVVTTILAGAALGAGIESLAETCRVLRVDALPADKDGNLALDRLEDNIRVLLPLSIPQTVPDEQAGSVQEQLERTLPATVDAATIQAIMAASQVGEAAVTSAVSALIDAALAGETRERA